MKRILTIFIAIFVSLSIYGASPSTMDERGILERTLIRMKLKKDIAKDFDYSRNRVYSRRSGGYRRIQSRIKNNASDDFQWVTFKVMMGEGKRDFAEVYRFTVHDFKRSKTYFLDSNVYVGDTKGKKMNIVYVDSKKRD